MSFFSVSVLHIIRHALPRAEPPAPEIPHCQQQREAEDVDRYRKIHRQHDARQEADRGGRVNRDKRLYQEEQQHRTDKLPGLIERGYHILYFVELLLGNVVPMPQLLKSARSKQHTHGKRERNPI